MRAYILSNFTTNLNSRLFSHLLLFALPYSCSLPRPLACFPALLSSHLFSCIPAGPLALHTLFILCKIRPSGRTGRGTSGVRFPIKSIPMTHKVVTRLCWHLALLE